MRCPINGRLGLRRPLRDTPCVGPYPVGLCHGMRHDEFVNRIGKARNLSRRPQASGSWPGRYEKRLRRSPQPKINARSRGHLSARLWTHIGGRRLAYITSDSLLNYMLTGRSYSLNASWRTTRRKAMGAPYIPKAFLPRLKVPASRNCPL